MLLHVLQCLRRPHTTKSYTTQNVSRVKVEKPWTKLISFPFPFVESFARL